MTPEEPKELPPKGWTLEDIEGWLDAYPSIVDMKTGMTLQMARLLIAEVRRYRSLPQGVGMFRCEVCGKEAPGNCCNVPEGFRTIAKGGSVTTCSKGCMEKVDPDSAGWIYA